MVKIINFVYVVLLFISLLLGTNTVDASFQRCETDDDCPKTDTPDIPDKWLCYKKRCYLIKGGTLEN
ncbi:unnamed protein product [Trifolium pratense]|uniref:Uncharacterized protein n=1 Tax=Trifolium pratense TaxID=57577 RepID=A0ACB0KSB4_TRIPR|nr:unnamed protein product [Trifolium pratense]